MGSESCRRCANGGRDYGFLSPRMRGVGEITQETDWPVEIIGQVSSPSAETLGKKERKKETKEPSEMFYRRESREYLLTYCGAD